jgi:hypothetical protein
MSFYNIYIETNLGKTSYILAIDETQVKRLVNAYLEGQENVIIKGATRKLSDNKAFIIYSITSFDMLNKTKEQIEKQINKEKLVLNKDKVSLRFYKRYGTNVTDDFTNGLGFGELKEVMPKTIKNLPKVKGKIFISHSTKNKEIVSKFCDLILNNGLNINTTKEVFNTSLEGSKPETGEDFKECIKKQLEEAKLVLQFISKEYKKSEVCLNEMGAAWVLCDNVIPLIIEENEYEVGFIHNTTQQVQLHNENHIFRLIDDLKTKGIVSEYKVERLNQKIKEFVSWLKKSQTKTTHSKTLFKPAKKISDIIEKQPNPFYKINRLTSTYFLKDDKFCFIPDNFTLTFLGYNNFKKTNHVELPTEIVTEYLGSNITSVLKGALWTNSDDNTGWLIYNDKRHSIDGMTFQLLTKGNNAIARVVVNSDQLHSVLEGDYFTLKDEDNWHNLI